MTVVYKSSFADNDFTSEDERGDNAWMRDILRDKVCVDCGEKVFRKRAFLWWQALGDIILCSECAEHTVNGLCRDVAELLGDEQAKGATGELYGPMVLKQQLAREIAARVKSQAQLIEYMQGGFAKR